MKRFNNDKLFTSGGYYDIDYILSCDYTFTVIMGARGTGKTYGVNRYILNNGFKFIYLRRTGTELDVAFNEYTNPLQAIDPEITSGAVVKNLKGIYRNEKIIGYGASLSTFHNLRGVNFEDVQIIVYDECIPEKHVKAIKDEYDVVLNMYETVNRNRELDGKKPVKLVMLSNSNNVNHPLIIGLGLADVFNDRHGVYIDGERSLIAINAVNIDFKEAKEKTALYRLSKDNAAFQHMALDNKFIGVKNDDIIRKINKTEYTHLCTIKINAVKINILRHKTNDHLYITSDKYGGCPDIYDCDIFEEKTRFCLEHRHLIKLRMVGLIYFNSLQTKLLFDNVIKK